MRCFAIVPAVLLAVLTVGADAVELQGHRGARGELPENTLPGFRAAIAAGADCLELDIAMTRDKELVITHDPALNADITRKGKDWITAQPSIKSLSIAELQAYDVGRIKPDTRYARRFSKQMPIDGVRIPRLAELFQMPEVVANPGLCLDIEIKTSPLDEDGTFAPAEIAERLVQLIDGAKFRGRSRVRSFDWRGLLAVKRIAPDIPLAFLTAKRSWLNNLEVGGAGKSPWLGGVDIDDFSGSAVRAVHHLGGQIWAPYFGDLTQVELDAAHRLGLRVIVWTVNDEATMRRLIAMGADGFTTDYPALGRRVIDDAGVRRR